VTKILLRRNEVKKGKFIALLASICLVVMLVLSACAEQAAPGAPAGAAQDKVYRVLNPTGVFVPVDCKACAPRLNSLAGKKILFYESEATNIILPTLLERLKKDYPTTTFDVVYTEAFGESTPTDQQKTTYQAVIRGVGW
jgi:hypothetical protein